MVDVDRGGVAGGTGNWGWGGGCLVDGFGERAGGGEFEGAALVLARKGRE